MVAKARRLVNVCTFSFSLSVLYILKHHVNLFMYLQTTHHARRQVLSPLGPMYSAISYTTLASFQLYLFYFISFLSLFFNDESVELPMKQERI